MIDKPLRIRVNDARRGAANIGLQLFEMLALEICEVRSPLHSREMRHEAFRELIEGVMAGRANGCFPSLIFRRHLDSLSTPEGYGSRIDRDRRALYIPQNGSQ
jgi:hypothetical protein